MLNTTRLLLRGAGSLLKSRFGAAQLESRNWECGMRRSGEYAQRWTLFVTTALVVMTAVIPADAGVVVLGAAADNTLIEDLEGDVSNGGSTGMFVGRNNQPTNSRRRGIILFDIAGGIPAGSTINGVTLQLSQSAANTGDVMISLHRVMAAWGEGTATASGGQGAPAEVGDATWLHAMYDNVPWTVPGGDFDAAISTQTLVGNPGEYTWPSTSGLVADVQAYLDNPAQNFGWILIGDESASQTSKRFATREEANDELRPRLLVEYTPIPEPGSAVLALSAIWLVRHRRRRD